MSETTNLNIKIDRELKSKADKLFSEMGMNLTTAVNVFVRQAVLERAIPFKISRGTATTASIDQRRAAMREVRDLLSGFDGSGIGLDQIESGEESGKI